MRRSVGAANSIASVLHGRLHELRLPERQPAALAERLPEARTESTARQAALMMDARAQAIGEQLAARPEPWLVDRLGLPPQQPGALRDDWVSRAGRAGFYRQAHGITDPNVAHGDMPTDNPELRMLWEQTQRDLEIPAEEVGLKAKSRADLETTVHAYTRAAETAPPDMARQLDYHHKQAAGLERQAEHAEADGDAQLAYDSRAAAAEETWQAAQLSAAQDTRDAWDRAHETKRLAARAARHELDRRGIEPEPERREPESLTAWWRQFEADAQAAERALGRQHQAAIDAGQPWPPRPAATTRTPDPEAHKAAEVPPRNGSLPGPVSEQKGPLAGMPEAAQPSPSRNFRQSPEVRPTSASGSTRASGGYTRPASAYPLTSKPSNKSVPAMRRGSPRKPSTRPRRPTPGRPATLRTGQLRWTTSPSSDPALTPPCGRGSSRSRGPTRSPAQRPAPRCRTPPTSKAPATLATSNAKYACPPGTSSASAAAL